MSKISSYFQSLAGRPAFIPFITAGFPNPALTVELMHTLVEGGADIIELGVPFSDPAADGEIIQRASEAALAQGVSLLNVLDMVKAFRQTNQHTPVVLMGYLNPIVALGYDTFAKNAATAGVNGVLTVDCPPEEAETLTKLLKDHEISPIFVISPTTSMERVQKIAQQAEGYLYYVSLKGVTGAGHLDIADVAQKIKQLKQNVSLPIAVGFGVRDAASVQAISEIADAVVVGSRLIQEIEMSEVSEVKTRLLSRIKELTAGLV